MQTLIVHYLPSGDLSHTKKLLDFFLKHFPENNYQSINLLHEKIPIFNEASIQAYYKRNYNNISLDEQESLLLQDNDRLISQFKSANNIVLAYPMHNFGIPAQVKAYLDAIIFNGETCAMGKKLMAGKKILTLYTSGGNYTEGIFNLTYPNWNTIEIQSKILFSFMGFDAVEVIGTSLRDPITHDENLLKVFQKIEQIIREWK